MKKIPFLFLVISVFAMSCSTAKYTTNEKSIIKKDYGKMIMPLMLVENKTDSVLLYTKSHNFKVNKHDKKLKKLVDLMYNTCIDPLNPGIGIAAPQVGINKRIIWVQRFDKTDTPFEVFFNIEILNYSESKSDGWEGCLSVPGYRGIVNRSDTIMIKYDTYDKSNVVETISGFTAVIFQHEIDHLNGILYTDRIVDRTKLLTNEEYDRLNESK